MTTTRALRPLAAVLLIALIGAGCSTGSEEGSGTTGTSSRAGSAQSTGRSKAARFSQCMRDNGVAGFPDPDADGQLTIDAVLNGSSLDSGSPEWKRAMDACRELQPSGFTGNGRTPEQQAAALKFAQCIRDNGVPDFPDPTPDGPMVDTNRIPSAATSDGMSVLNAAMRKCGDRAAAAGVQGP